MEEDLETGFKIMNIFNVFVFQDIFKENPLKSSTGENAHCLLFSPEVHEAHFKKEETPCKKTKKKRYLSIFAR